MLLNQRTPRLARTTPGLSQWLHRYRYGLMLLGLLSLPFLAFAQNGLKTNRQLSALFAADDPALVDYQDLQATFGGNLVAMIVYEDSGLMSAEGLARNRNLTQQAEGMAGVEGVLSMAKLVDAFGKLRPSLFSSWSSDAKPALYRQDDVVANQFRDLFAGYTHSVDEKTASVVVMLTPDRAQETIFEMRDVVRRMPTSLNPVLVGEPVLLQDAYDMIEADGRRLSVTTLGLLAIVILFSLRDWRVATLAVVCIAWANWATRAELVWIGVELSLVSTILLSLISVIVVASVMHVGVRLSAPATQSWQLGQGVVAVLAMPVLWTCATDLGGFASLLGSSVEPVFQFGLMTSLAVINVLVALVLFTPGLIAFNAWPEMGEYRISRRVRRCLRSVVLQSMRRSTLLGAGSIVIIMATAIYVTQLKTNASFLDNFRGDSEIVRAYRQVEQRLGGAGVWDVVLPAPSTITPKYLAKVTALERGLRAIQVPWTEGLDVSGRGVDPAKPPKVARLTKVLSLADADAVASQITMLSLVPPDARLAGMRAVLPAFAEALLTFPSEAPSSRKLRIMLRSDESLPGAVKLRLISAVRNELRKYDFDTSTAEEKVTVTGYSVLMLNLVSSLIHDQWRTLGLAVSLVGCLVWVATGSFADTLAALTVNVLPILVVLTTLGIAGGKLDLGSAMIGAVSIGLSIDGSIHFLAGYRRRMGDSDVSSTQYARVAACARTSLCVGAPIMLSTLALTIGFAVLVGSRFVPTSTFGLLTAVTLAFSAVANLTLLPATLVLLHRALGAVR